MQYVVKGRFFDDEEEAKKYEEELKTKEEENKKKKEAKDQRFKELKDIEEEYINKVNEFYKDYGYIDINLSGLPNSFDGFFDNFGRFFNH